MQITKVAYRLPLVRTLQYSPHRGTVKTNVSVLVVHTNFSYAVPHSVLLFFFKYLTSLYILPL